MPTKQKVSRATGSLLGAISNLDEFLAGRQELEEGKGINPEILQGRDEADKATIAESKRLLSTPGPQQSNLSGKSLFPGMEAEQKFLEKQAIPQGKGFGGVAGVQANRVAERAAQIGNLAAQSSVRAPMTAEEQQAAQEQAGQARIAKASSLVNGIKERKRNDIKDLKDFSEMAKEVEIEAGKERTAAQQMLSDEFKQGKDIKSKAELQKLKNKGAVDAIGAKKGSAGIGSLTPKVQSDLQLRKINAQQALGKLHTLGKTFDPAAFTFAGQAEGTISQFMNKLGNDDPSREKFLADRQVFTEQVEEFFNAYRKSITGAAASVQELESLKKAVLNMDQSPAQAKGSLRKAVRQHMVDTMAYDSMLMGDKPIFPGDELFESQFEINKSRVEQEAGAKFDKIINEQYPALRIGETSDNILKRAKQDPDMAAKLMQLRRERGL